MDKILVNGGRKLSGSVDIDGAKNAALPILAATVLAETGQNTLNSVPLLSDIYIMKEVLTHLNLDVSFDEEKKQMRMDAARELNSDTPFDFMSKMRASIVVMGPLLARTGYAKVALPGGCAIGSRPIDLHLKGFEAMGVDVHIGNGHIEASVDRLKGAHIYLDFPSVGATQNIMMAATLAEGTTIMENVAREPEIVDLANFLNKMGAKVVGAGTETLKIEGVESLQGTEHAILPDRIESGTFMIAAAVTQGDILIKECVPEHNKPLISKLREMGVTFIESSEGLRVIGPDKLKPTDVKTMPHPGFPTDMQSPMTIAQLVAEGTSIMRETVFENRYMHMEELRKMNASFQVDSQSVIIHGGNVLQGAEVAASDLRAAAALILAGLTAKGYTRVTNLSHLDRGYSQFHIKMQKLGADIERISDEEAVVEEAIKTTIT
ncbi:UDP-N-acetylglucosamine 1-carboxyvinyltransferase [Alkalibacterium sp. AK22]|uniref:UDP-N-acetylglucosamine 1-carboxyvinyltransferase n=1 Tax=Alkalibacterium sp. AK22 TaxID=1229520 RepID=UPI00044E3DDD|nr:UDP-N-acetylglucosamine 1-carboxyvinyltransferase [Alkalibacterium sp. AK22]EXJ23500.1 UDP-N-acetylglucosamine 1-carboxyvinyltransferase [Alkalibacterium sp. AK22]